MGTDLNTPELPAGPAHGLSPARPAADLFRNLAGGMRLALLLPATRADFRPSLVQALLLFLISLCLTAAYDLYLVWPAMEFSIVGLYYQAMLYLLFFASVILMAAGAGVPASTVLLTVSLLAVSPTTFVIYTSVIFGLQYLPAAAPSWLYELVTPAYLAWYLFIVLRAIRVVLAPVPARGAALLITFGVFNVVPWFYLPSEPLWRDEYPEADIAAAPPDVERLFFQQDELLAEGIEGLMEQRPGVVDVYFIGIAGDAGEDVFMNEAQQAARVFARDFDAAGRTLLLVNNHQTFDRLPLASRDNLVAALDAVGNRMDREEDLLVLFMTSHGEEDQGLVLDLDGFPLAPISPRSLRAALDAAGIRYRAVIVSACFSGSFVAEFRDAGSMVMTSARGDRSSFGCGHDGLFTYFGSAFLGTELPRERSLVPAFERARESLGAREAEEGLPPSEPQIWVGGELQELLERLDARLRAGPLPAPEAPGPPREAVSARGASHGLSAVRPVGHCRVRAAPLLHVAAEEQPDFEQQPER